MRPGEGGLTGDTRGNLGPHVPVGASIFSTPVRLSRLELQHRNLGQFPGRLPGLVARLNNFAIPNSNFL